MDATTVAKNVIQNKLQADLRMANEDSHHVVHNPNGGWDVKCSNSKKSSHHAEKRPGRSYCQAN